MTENRDNSKVSVGPPRRLTPAFELNDTDREVLSLTDAQFHLHSWEELKVIIATNKLETLKRKPSDLVRYIEWTSSIKDKYGSITNFICEERLRWRPLNDFMASGSAPVFLYKNAVPFADADDFKVLLNDWPYGLDPEITHLVVWLKTPIPVDVQRGDLLPESRAIIERFVEGFFTRRLARAGLVDDRVLWFKNWVKLQSVRGLDHIHVLVRDVPRSIVHEWTGMDQEDTASKVALGR